MGGKRTFTNPVFTGTYIEQDKLAAILAIAGKKKKTVSQIIREALDYYIKRSRRFLFWGK